MDGLVFLKLGGSLITDKTAVSAARMGVIERLAAEIAAALAEQPELRLVLGHGSGSFGHVAASKHGTRQGVRSPETWLGFTEVWREARALNQIVVTALHHAGVPVIAFPPSAGVIAEDGVVNTWDVSPLRAALEAGLVPLVNGDTVFDRARGGTILSTEDVFAYLARCLSPQRILLAGIDEGVCEDYPANKWLIRSITGGNIHVVARSLRGSAAVDVTGGMERKVNDMLALAKALPGLEVIIFSGRTPGLVKRTLNGDSPGTMIKA